MPLPQAGCGSAFQLLSAWERTRSLPLERKNGELASRKAGRNGYCSIYLCLGFLSCSLEYLSLQLSKKVDKCFESLCASEKVFFYPCTWLGQLGVGFPSENCFLGRGEAGMMLMRITVALEDSLPFPLFLPGTFFWGWREGRLSAAFGFLSSSLAYWSFVLYLVFLLHALLWALSGPLQPWVLQLWEFLL